METSTLGKLDIAIHMVSLGTRLDQVVDVFYVGTTLGENIQDVIHCEQIQRAIQKSVNAFLNEVQQRNRMILMGVPL